MSIRIDCFTIYTGWPRINGTVDTVDSSLCWIEHLFPIIITSRSSNLIENFSFYETFIMDCHFRDLPISRVSRHDDKLMANPKNDSR